VVKKAFFGLKSLVFDRYRPFCFDTKRTKKIKAVFKSYDFLKFPGARKKLAPPIVGTQTVFRFSPLQFQKIGI
jgi:hypothetical protein